jgi:hypothetical protein
MTDAVFFRLLDADDKAAALADAVATLSSGGRSPGVTYLADPQS